MIPLVLAVAVLFQQSPGAQRPSPQAPPAAEATTTGTRQAIVDVGRSVALLRTAHDALRRAAFNFTDEVVVQRSQEMRQRCQDLTAMARAATGQVCRGCWSAAVQPSITAYRAGLPGVAQVGTRCASQVAQYLRAPRPAEAVRRGIWAVGRTVVEGLVPYERRLRAVRQAFGLTDQAAPHR